MKITKRIRIMCAAGLVVIQILYLLSIINIKAAIIWVFTGIVALLLFGE